MNQSRPGDIKLVPAPWELSGQAYVISVRMPREVLEHESFIPAGLAHASRSSTAYLMFVDYAQSNIGPYRELLYIPGKLRFGTDRFLSITRIYVSSWESVINGENNWGIPKDRCDFEVSYGKDGIERIALTAVDGTRFAELELQTRGLPLPALGHLVPERYRKLAQLKDGKRYTYAPKARGWFKFARVRNLKFDSRYFPDLSKGTAVRAIKLTHFDMVFPVARITPMT